MIGARRRAERRRRDDVDDAGRQAGILEQLREQQRRQRRELGRLDDDGAAGGERRRDLAGRHREREVPRRDEEARPDRMLRDDHAPGALGVRARSGRDAHGLLAEPAQELAAVGDLAVAPRRAACPSRASSAGRSRPGAPAAGRRRAQDLAAGARRRWPPTRPRLRRRRRAPACRPPADASAIVLMTRPVAGSLTSMGSRASGLATRRR